MARLILIALMLVGYPFSAALADTGWLHMFAHANLAHLALNVIALWSFAKPVERELGSLRTLLVFFAAAFMAYAMQLFLTPDAIMVGASGGIFGLVAVAVCANPKAKIGLPLLMFPGPIVLAAIMVLSTICLAFGLLPGIAHAAHLAGIVVGLIVMCR